MEDPQGMVGRIRYALDDRFHFSKPFSGDETDQVHDTDNKQQRKQQNTGKKESRDGNHKTDNEDLGETFENEEKLAASDKLDEEEESRNSVKG